MRKIHKIYLVFGAGGPQGSFEIKTKNIYVWPFGVFVLNFRSLLLGQGYETLIFYKHRNFFAKAFAKHKLCFKKTTKAYMCLKIWPKPLCAYHVQKYRKI